jgi:hypothetical protein
LEQLRSAIGSGTLDSQITDVATVGAIGLALLTYFTDRQGDTLAKVRADLTSYTAREIQRQTWRDILLAALTLAGLVALIPLVPPAIRHSHLFHQSGVDATLFLIVVVGYSGLLVLQFSNVLRRASRLHDKTNQNRWCTLFRRL